MKVCGQCGYLQATEVGEMISGRICYCGPAIQSDARQGMVPAAELRKLLLYAECLWMLVPYEKRAQLNTRDMEHARTLLGEKEGK